MYSRQALEQFHVRSHMLQYFRGSDGSMPARAAVDDYGHGGLSRVAAAPFAKDCHELVMHVGQPMGKVMVSDHPRNDSWMHAVVIYQIELGVVELSRINVYRWLALFPVGHEHVQSST